MWISGLFTLAWDGEAVTLSAPDVQVERAAVRLANPRLARDGEQVLITLSGDRDENRRAGAAVILADHYRRNGDLVRAAALVAPWADMCPENLQPNRLEALLEHARCEAAAGHPLAAFRILDYARENTAGLVAVLVRIAYADVVELAPDYDKALVWLREAVEIGDRWIRPPAVSVGERPVLPAGAERWLPLRVEIMSRLKSLGYKADVARWGQDFVLYRDAQTARQADHPQARNFTDISRLYPGRGAGRATVPDADYPRALVLYDQLIAETPDSVFAEAARFYRTFCLIHLGREAEAVRDLKAFIASAPMGLYRGEALLTLGDVYLQSGWAPAAAKPFYAESLAWCERASSAQDAARLYSVPAKAVAPSAAPLAWQTMNSSGIIGTATFPPGAVINRLTAPWYLNWLRVELHFRLGFLACLADEWKEACTHWQSVLNYDQTLLRARRNRYYNTLDRLEAAAAIQYLVGRKEENAQLPPELKPAIGWADFLFMRESFEEAESLYGRLYRTASERGDGTVAVRAALGFVLRCYGEAGRLPPAQNDAMLARGRTIGETVLKRFPQAPASAYVAFMIAYSTPLNPLGDKNRKNTAQEAMRRVITNYPRSRHVAEARFWEIFTGLNAQTLAARKPSIERFRQDFPDSGWIRHLDDEVEFIHSRQESQKNTQQ